MTTAAKDPHLRGDARVRAVFDRVRGGDADAAADLYAPDGVVLAGGTRIEGREAVRAFYKKTMEAIRPQPRVQLVLSAPGSEVYAVTVEVPTDRGLVHALDLFTLGDDGIRQLEIFSRPIG